MGEIVCIWIKHAHGGPMDRVQEARLVAGRGIVDNADQRGSRQITLIDEAAWLDAVHELGADVDPSARRANVLLRGVDLENSRLRMLRLGECVIRLLGETHPCRLMDEAEPGLRKALRARWRGGAFGEIVQGGTIRVGDRVGWNDTYRRPRAGKLPANLPPRWRRYSCLTRYRMCAQLLGDGKKMMRPNFLILFTAALVLALAGCQPKSETGGGAGGTAAGGGDILVGEYGSLTGPQATFGQSTHNGIMMAMDEVNAAGGINGRKIKVLTEDDQSKQEEAANAVTKLISQNGVMAVLGEVASSNSMAAAPICQSNKVPMISPSSTNDAVTQKGDYIFRVCFTDTYQGEALGNYVANQLKVSNAAVRRAAVLTDVKSDYSTGLAAQFEKTFKSKGGQIVGKQSYANGDSDFRSQLTAVKANNPQVLFIPGYYTDIGQIAIQARDLGLTQPLVGGDGWESPKLIEIGGKSLEGCMYSNHYFYADPAPLVRNFVQKYKDRYGAVPDALAALGYDAARVLADAMKRASKLDGPSIRDAIAATKGFAGVTGTITIGPERNAVGKKLVIEEIKNGQLTLKATVQPDTTSTGAASTH